MTYHRNTLSLLTDEMLIKLLDKVEERLKKNAEEYYEILEDETLVSSTLIARGFVNKDGLWRKLEKREEIF